MLFPSNDFWMWRAIPAIVIILDVVPTLFPVRFYPNLKGRIGAKLRRSRLKSIADRIISISAFTADTVNHLYDVERQDITVIYPGIEPEFFQSSNCPKDQMLDERYLLFVGGFDFRKNIKGLLEAFNFLKERGYSGRLLLVGMRRTPGSIYLDVDKLIIDKNLCPHVEVLEGITDRQLRGLYQDADALVLPSFVEGFGLPPVEAMACGCPVVVSNRASLPEVVGEAGLYCDPDQPEMIASAIWRLITDARLRKRVIAKGLARSEYYRWERAACEFIEIVEDFD
jgi:glycosyltransferase involved in cell wall biosynthesis